MAKTKEVLAFLNQEQGWGIPDGNQKSTVARMEQEGETW